MKKINSLLRGGVYAAPSLEIAKFSVERGFAVSGTGSAGWEDGDKENNLGEF